MIRLKKVVVEHRNFFLILGLIILDTVCYNLPSTIYSLESIDFQAVQTHFYSFYCLLLTMLFLSFVFFSIVIYMIINKSDYKSKILSAWLIIAATATLIDHVLRKYFFNNWFSSFQKPITIIVFGIFCGFFASRAIFKPKSDPFDPRKSYIVNFIPKNLPALITWIINRSGHKAIFQDMELIKFKSYSGVVEISEFAPNFVDYERMSFKEIPRVKDMDRFIGKQFKFFTYNCNHLARDAQRA